MSKLTVKPKSSKKAKEAKFQKVMDEFKNGTLRSSSGEVVTDRAQALAIAASEAGISFKKALSPSTLSFLKQRMTLGEMDELAKAVSSTRSHPGEMSSYVNNVLYHLNNVALMYTDEEIAMRIDLVRDAIQDYIPANMREIIMDAFEKIKGMRGNLLQGNIDTNYKLMQLITSLLAVDRM